MKSTIKTGDGILFLLFLISTGLAVLGITIYRQTIIETKYILGIVILGIITGSILLSFIKSSYSKTWTSLIRAAIGSGIFYFAFLFINQQYADKEWQTDQFQILKKGTLSSAKGSDCAQPYVEIDFYGVEKELLFYCQETDSIKHATSVTISYSKGLFGFNIIQSKALLQ